MHHKENVKALEEYAFFDGSLVLLQWEFAIFCEEAYRFLEETAIAWQDVVTAPNDRVFLPTPDAAIIGKIRFLKRSPNTPDNSARNGQAGSHRAMGIFPSGRVPVFPCGFAGGTSTPGPALKDRVANRGSCRAARPWDGWPGWNAATSGCRHAADGRKARLSPRFRQCGQHT